MSLVARAIIAFEAAPLPDSVRKGAVSFLVGRVKNQMKSVPQNAAADFAEDIRNIHSSLTRLTRS